MERGGGLSGLELLPELLALSEEGLEPGDDFLSVLDLRAHVGLPDRKAPGESSDFARAASVHTVQATSVRCSLEPIDIATGEV